MFSFRDSTKEEKIQISNLNKEAEVLEFFEDVYAGFLQLLLQLYIFAITFDFERNDFKKDIFRMFPLLNIFALKAILNFIL